MKGVSLFSGAGIGEFFFRDIGIKIVAANELLSSRANMYSHFHPDTRMITGDMRKREIKSAIKSFIGEDIKFLIATPPCQGVSSVGKNKRQADFNLDQRNFLIFDTFEIIDSGDFDYILIENTPRFLKMFFPYKGGLFSIKEILVRKYSSRYWVEADILDAKDYGVPQTRPRAIIRMYKRGLSWHLPRKKKMVSLKKVIGHLPSLEPGEDSKIRFHTAKKERENIVTALRHTSPGKSALKNRVHYPKKENGERIKGFHNTYKRMVWEKPAHARTTYCGNISSHNNVHPGRRKQDGTYSDPRVLTILETLIVSSLPKNIKFPHWASDGLIRTIIGEGIPPLMLKEIMLPALRAK